MGTEATQNPEGRGIDLGGILRGMALYFALNAAAFLVIILIAERVIYERFGPRGAENVEVFGYPLLLLVPVVLLAIITYRRGSRGTSAGIVGGYAIMFVASGGTCNFVWLGPVAEVTGPIVGIVVYVLVLIVLGAVVTLRSTREDPS
jgi:hypothetical protein